MRPGLPLLKANSTNQQLDCKYAIYLFRREQPATDDGTFKD